METISTGEAPIAAPRAAGARVMGKGRRGALVASSVFIAVILAGGFFVPYAGLAAPLLIAVAVIANFRSSRWFCARACPRGIVLGGLGPGLSRFRKMPGALYSDGARKGACAFMVACAVGQTLRLLPRFDAIGRFFWLICAISFVLSILMAILYKPRSWCAVCPVGTLQSTLRRGGGRSRPRA